MSTRCQIEFREVQFNGTRMTYEARRTIYQHSDGYPNGQHGVIQRLKDFFEWESRERGFEAEYTPANFIYWSKKKDVEQLVHDFEEYDTQKAEDMVGRLGYGICNNGEFHDDIEYFYEIIHTLSAGKKQLVVRSYEVQPPSNPDIPLGRSHFKALEEVVL